jgi:capsular polysaccharide biosynthesis protein
LLGIAIFGGILAAFGLCLLLETLDTTISLPEHAEHVLGLPVLASIQMKKTGG